MKCAILLITQYKECKRLLEENIDILHEMAKALMKYETIDALQVDDLMSRVKVRDQGDWGDSYDPEKSNDKNRKIEVKDVSQANNSDIPKEESTSSTAEQLNDSKE